MPCKSPSPKPAIIVESDIEKRILAAAAREDLQGRAGFGAVAAWERQYRRLTLDDMEEARRSVLAQQTTALTISRAVRHEQLN
jgi:hypothetical protein